MEQLRLKFCFQMKEEINWRKNYYSLIHNRRVCEFQEYAKLREQFGATKYEFWNRACRINDIRGKDPTRFT